MLLPLWLALGGRRLVGSLETRSIHFFLKKFAPAPARTEIEGKQGALRTLTSSLQKYVERVVPRILTYVVLHSYNQTSSFV